MRSLKFALAAMAATMALGTAQAETGQIRIAWVAAVSNWPRSCWREGPRQAHRKSYTLESIRFAGTPPMRRRSRGELEIATSPIRPSRWRCRTPTWMTCASSPTNSRTASPALPPTNGRAQKIARSRRSRTSRQDHRDQRGRSAVDIAAARC